MGWRLLGWAAGDVGLSAGSLADRPLWARLSRAACFAKWIEDEFDSVGRIASRLWLGSWG